MAEPDNVQCIQRGRGERQQEPRSDFEAIPRQHAGPPGQADSQPRADRHAWRTISSARGPA